MSDDQSQAILERIDGLERLLADRHGEAAFLSDRAVGARYGVARGTVWRWLAAGGFPAPIKLDSGTTRWKLGDLLAWEQTRTSAAVVDAQTPRRRGGRR